MVSEHENVSRLLQGGFEVGQIGDLEVNVREPVVRDAVFVAGGAEAEPGRIEGHVNRLILARERPVAPVTPAAPAGRTSLRFLRSLFGQFTFLLVRLAFVALKHADNAKGLVVDENVLPERAHLTANFSRTAEP